MGVVIAHAFALHLSALVGLVFQVGFLHPS
jgi:hypothetical protein